MKRNIMALAAFAIATLTATAQNPELLIIDMNDGTTKTIPVADIKQLSFGTEEPTTMSGAYTGVTSVQVGDMATYTADITCTIVENADGTLNFTWPQYQLADTVMGDLTLGTLTIPNIPYVEEKNAYYLNYSSLGLTQFFSNGTSMNQDYVLGETSEITIEKTADGIKVTNPFKLGRMPFPLTQTFTGKK